MKIIVPNILLAFAFVVFAGTARAQIVPIDVTGFNLDVVLSGGSDGFTGDVSGASGTNLNGGGYHYFTNTYATENSGFGTGGLPDSGTITSAFSSAVFQFQPYTQNNVLSVGKTALSLDLAPSATGSYSELALLLNNPSGTRTVQSFTFNFLTGPSTTFTTSDPVPYWAAGSAVQYTPVDTAPGQSAGVALNDNPLEIYNGTTDAHDGTAVHFDEYDFTLSGADASRILTSITIDADSSSTNRMDIYAVSGTLAAPEPRTWAMLAAGLSLLLFIGRSRAKQGV